MQGWSYTIIILAFILAATNLWEGKLNQDWWIIVNAIQIARIVTIENTHIVPNARLFFNNYLGTFTFLFNIDYLPYDLILNQKAISYEFTQYWIASEMFLVYLLNSVTVLVMAIGFFIIVLSLFECCKPSNTKSWKCNWMNSVMRVCVEYITFNAFLRWFHEFCLTLFISCLFNLRINAGLLSNWAPILSYTFCLLFLVFVFLYLVWIVYYFRWSRWPATLDLPVTAVKRWENEFTGLGET